MKKLLILSLIFIAYTAEAKKVIYRKTQSVNFDGTDVDGVARNPDGAYLLQKRGVKFMPMYKVKEKFHDEIIQSVDYLR